MKNYVESDHFSFSGLITTVKVVIDVPCSGNEDKKKAKG